MTRVEIYRQRAANYARQALEADPRHQAMFAELARAWRELADREDGSGDPAEARAFGAGG